MILETFTYTADVGWSGERLPALDSPSTLVLAFGASEFFGDPGALAELSRAYPKSHLIGCSTSG